MLRRINDFFFSPASPRPLAYLRMGISLTLLLQALMCWQDFFEWYGTEGFLQGNLLEKLSWGLPQTTQIISFFSRFGVGEKTTLVSLGITYVLSLMGLLIGWKPRFFSLIAWAIHLAIGQGHVTGYGLDLFAHISLFYFIWMPSQFSAPPSSTAQLSIRVWQIHLSIVYFASGVEKAMGWDWRHGAAIWRSLMMPIYHQFEMSWIAWVPWLSLLLGWFTLVVEIGYPFFIFPTKTRMLWVFLTVGMHFGIALFLGLHLFALIMSVFTICAFGLTCPRVHLKT